MEAVKFCPICGDVLVLIEHEYPEGGLYYQWECPEQDWFEPEHLVVSASVE